MGDSHGHGHGHGHSHAPVPLAGSPADEDQGLRAVKVSAAGLGLTAAVEFAFVAASGSVGYVGLIVPHLVRLSVGSDNRLVVPFSAVAGAIFVVFADTVARTAIAPRELPVGAVTALVGAPLFIYLLRKN